MVTTTERGAPTSYSDFGIPRSWYRVAWSSELTERDVLPLSYFGRDLVLYRTSEGVPVVLDAFCQHLGAHLGYGGTVENECIICPFHGWSWRPDGSNANIPYAPNPARRTLRTWTVREANGMVWVWFDEEGRPPTFDIPQLAETIDGSYVPFAADGRKVWPDVRIHPLQPAENTADPAHIRYVHGAGVIPDVDDFRSSGPVFSTFLRYEWGAGKTSTWLTPDGPVEGVLDADCHGLGLIVTRYSGIWPTIQLTGCTPIDGERSDYYTAILVKQGIDDDLRERIYGHFFAAVEADFPIWENMTWIEHPPLPRLESKVMRQVRAWSRQFIEASPAVPPKPEE